MNPHKRAVLLVNLGSPDSPSVDDVRSYLNQFLMDPYVVDLPWPLRRMLVSLFVLPTRPAKSAEAYASIWLDEGSPLKVINQKLAEEMAQHTDLPIALAMRYGNPAIEQELLKLAKMDGIEEILLLPLYPHYAMSSVKTCVEEVRRVMAKYDLHQKLTIHSVFYQHPDYIDNLLASAETPLNELKSGQWDHLLFSYHGVPVRHIRKDDSTGKHCLSPDCCNRPSEAHATCYRHQVFATTKAFAAQAGLTDEQWSLAFQSRLGRDKWLEPATDQTIIALAKKGIKRLLVICPAFTVDCLETLEEIGIHAKESFLAHGGSEFQLIPCLNDNPQWAKTLAKWVEEYPATTPERF